MRQRAPTECRPPPRQIRSGARWRRLGFAVVGLGRLAWSKSFAQSGQARLAALVTESPDKLVQVAGLYGIAADACYAYEDFDSLSRNPEVHAVFIALANALHRPFVERDLREVEETAEFLLRFPCGLTADSSCSYGARENKWQRLELEHARIDMPNAFDYQGQRLVIGHRQGDDVGLQEVVIAPVNHFMAEIDHFTAYVREDREPATPGEERLRDHLLMEAIYRSAKLGRPVRISSPHTSEGKA